MGDNGSGGEQVTADAISESFQEEENRQKDEIGSVAAAPWFALSVFCPQGQEVKAPVLLGGQECGIGRKGLGCC